MPDFETNQATQTEVPTQQEVDARPEMPASHPDVDPATLTKDGLIEACKYFAELATLDPALAEKQAERTIAMKKQETEMRQKGADDNAVKAQKFASMRGRHRAKTETKEDKEPKAEVTPEPELIEPETVQPAEQMLQDEEVQTVVEKEPPIVAERSTSPQPEQHDTEPQEIATHVQLAQEAAIHQEYLDETIARTSGAQDIPATKMPDISRDLVELPQELLGTNLLDLHLSEAAPASQELEVDESELTSQLPSTESGGSQNISHETEFTDKELEVFFAPEVVEVYKELQTIIDTHEEKEFILAEPAEMDATELSVTAFETFIADQPMIEEPLSFESVQEQADEQPLEQTIVQVVAIIAHEEKLDATPELAQIIKDLREVVDTYKADDESYPTLTPEVAEQLVQLLQAMGYEKPTKALVECVETHDYEFLWQAIEHLIDQFKIAEQKTASVNLWVVGNDSARPSLVGFIFALVGILHTEPVV